MDKYPSIGISKGLWTGTSEYPSTRTSEFPLIRTSERNDLRMAFQCRVSLNLRCSDEGSSEHFESELRLITRPRAGRSCLIGNVLNIFELDFEAGKEGRFEGMKSAGMTKQKHIS